MEQGIRELEAAASTLLASPSCVSGQQRHVAEELFLNFRKIKNPFALCKCILDSSQSDLVLFEAAGLLKDSLIREWKTLSSEDLKQWRQYLLNYVVERIHLPSYVRERVLQVVAILVKRGSAEDGGADRGLLLSQVEHLVVSGDPAHQMVACSVLSAVMQEYANTVKSSDVHLSWEVHFRLKRQFESSDLKCVFQFAVRALSELMTDELLARDTCLLLGRLLAIAEAVLTWFFIPATMLPKRLIGVFEADLSPSLRPNQHWADVLLEPGLLQLFFKLHYKVRHLPDLCHHTLNCLVQLASLNGPIVANSEPRVHYLTHYLSQWIGFVRSVELHSRETLGVSQMFRKLLLYYPADTLVLLGEELTTSFLASCTKLTCSLAEKAEMEEAAGEDDRLCGEAFENMLIGWDSLGVDSVLIKDEWRMEILYAYIKCHLGPPDGIRGEVQDQSGVDEIEETQEDDKTKYKDQLNTMASFARSVCEHSLVLLARLLEQRITQFSVQLQRMHAQSFSPTDQQALTCLFDDLHWLLLISGHVIALDSDGETPVIPQEILRLSINQTARTNVEITLKVMASPGNRASDVAGMEEGCDSTVRLVASALRLCEVERRAADSGLGLLLSPELGTTVVWWLRRFASTYLLANESLYSELSPCFSAAFGRDSEGANWIMGFLLNKVESNLRTQAAEASLMDETLKLFMVLVDTKEKRNVVINSGPFWTLVRLHNSNELLQLCGSARRRFFQALTIAGAGVSTSGTLGGLGDQNYFWNQVLRPLQDRLLAAVHDENFRRVIHQDDVRRSLVTAIESLIGIVMGSTDQTVRMLFSSVQPVLVALPELLSVAHNYALIVELVLELVATCARQMLIFLPQDDSQKLYQLSLNSIQAYALHAGGRISKESSAEEDVHRDLVLFMELLMNLLSKDLMDLSPISNENIAISASEVCLHGLNLIMPLMNAELLRFPQLCSHYFKLITFACEICPAKIASLSPDMLSSLFASLQLGLESFGPDIGVLCFDFIQVLAIHLVKSDGTSTNARQVMKPFLKIVLEMVLSQQVSSDMLNTASGALYALICVYQEEYQELVGSLLLRQEDDVSRQRLVNAFNQLTLNVPLNAERVGRMKFRDNFDVFVMDARSLLVMK